MIRSLLLFVFLGHPQAVREVGIALLAEEALMDVDANVSAHVQAESVDGAHLTSDASAEERQTRQGAFKGTVLRGRYVLEELQVAKVDPPKKFPEIGKYLSANAQDKHLGTGTFGDVWKAWDAEQNSYVAVKAFHMNGKHISWKTAGEWGQELLEKQKEECAAVQDIVKKGLQMGSPYNGYVQYLCQCYADHIEKDFSSEPAFLVLEFCGRDVYHDIIEKARKGATPPQNRDYLRQRRHIIQDVLKGLSVLQNLNPPLMHHDIKPDNICVSDSSGKPIAKLVDFAARMIATEDTKKSAAISHPAYRPPEVATGRTSGWAWDGEPWSYDIYSLGLVYTELLCPAVTRTYWLNTEEKNPTPKEWSPQEAISAECKALAGLGLDPDFSLLGRMTSFKPAERPPPVDCVAEMDKMP